MKALPYGARLFHLAVCLLGFAAAAHAISSRVLIGRAPLWEIAVYAVLAVVAGGKKIQVIGRSQAAENGSLSLGIAVIFAAILRGGPHAGLVVALLSCLSSCLYPARQPSVQLLFNLSLTAFQSWLSGLTFVWLNRGAMVMDPVVSLPAAASAGIVYFALNSAGLAGIIALCRRESPVSLWRQTIVQTGPTYLATVAIIALAVILSEGNAGAIMLFGAPIAFLVYQSYAAGVLLDREKQARIDELQVNEARLAELVDRAQLQARQQRALTHVAMLGLSGLTVDEWMQQATEAVARTLEVEYAALLQLASSPVGEALILRAGVGWQEGLVGRMTVPAGLESLSGYTLLSRSMVVVESFADEVRFEPGPLLDSHDIGSGLATVVMNGDGTPWGVLGIYAKEPRTYEPAVRDFIQSASHLLALALDRYGHAALLEARSEEINALNVRLQRAMAETHHRVKNNLQIIAGLVDLQVMDHPDAIPISEIERLSRHVCGLAAIHDLLTFQAKNGGEVDCISTRAAFDRLLPLVRGVTGATIVHCAVDDIYLPIHKTTSLAILVNELVCNAVKHGSNEIDITLEITGDHARLEVCDDGPGFPEGFHPGGDDHTGLELVESLSRWDLQGRPEYRNRAAGGASVAITFPASVPVEGHGHQGTFRLSSLEGDAQ